MSSVVALLRSWSRPRVVWPAVIAVGLAGCSGDSSRFAESPFAAKSSNGEVTGSVAPTSAPVGRVEQAALPPPAASRPSTTAASSPSAGVTGGGRGLAAYHPPSGQDVTGSVPAPRKPAQPSGQWTWDGGTAVTVAQGDTVEVIAQRYGVPASAIIQANQLPESGAITPGRRLVIPRYNTASVVANRPPATAAARPTPAPAAAPLKTAVPAGSGLHVVAAGDTLTRISKLYNKPLAEIVKANNMAPGAKLNIGDRIVIPGVRTTSAAGKDAAKLAQSKPLAAPKGAAAPTAPAAGDEPAQNATLAKPSADPAPTAATTKAAVEATPSFRRPVNGRIIAGFGPKTNGQQNDGINFAVPEGTPVKAAEDGVVAYAGSELKGYGNLVLVRHSNGYVTAYAHAKELMVKRGDTIKRGQVIAKSGQTGNVDAPQLHFEVRKGPAPLDPAPLLNGG
ncbi:MAG: hypothetical protein QOI12_2399 [Alphaproteobacteria bacterium]|jgi:murein DD-endopeptidase MepM/ murein hydrolase activator NlpD|nr:hypothetical protein [Alphaproteobacteria bacterium]